MGCRGAEAETSASCPAKDIPDTPGAGLAPHTRQQRERCSLASRRRRSGSSTARCERCFRPGSGTDRPGPLSTSSPASDRPRPKARRFGEFHSRSTAGQTTNHHARGHRDRPYSPMTVWSEPCRRQRDQDPKTSFDVLATRCEPGLDRFRRLTPRPEGHRISRRPAMAPPLGAMPPPRPGSPAEAWRPGETPSPIEASPIRPCARRRASLITAAPPEDGLAWCRIAQPARKPSVRPDGRSVNGERAVPHRRTVEPEGRWPSDRSLIASASRSTPKGFPIRLVDRYFGANACN